MSDISLILAVLAGIAVAIPVLFLFRRKGRTKCWRCRVWMLPVRVRTRKYSFLPIGNCEGCNVWCLALGPRAKKKKTSTSILR